TWYGWDGDRLTTIQNDRSRIQTIYQPGSFTPLIRVETATGELTRTQRRSLPLALISTEGATAWCAEYDEWGNLLNEENPHQLQQLIRLPG
ncbi:RHS domain-containing protein, partial [Escherichia coli]|uniref:RHS domain-containing protein n=1 Tax=Escherichia coli TaxID=562 RepID=UPI001CD06A58